MAYDAGDEDDVDGGDDSFLVVAGVVNDGGGRDASAAGEDAGAEDVG